MVGLKEDTTGYNGPFVDKLPVPTCLGRRGTAAVLVRTSGFYRPAEALGACRFVTGRGLLSSWTNVRQFFRLVGVTQSDGARSRGGELRRRV